MNLIPTQRSPYDNTIRNGVKVRKMKIKLFIKSKGRCAYCHCKVIIPEPLHGGIQFKNTATLDHVYQKWDIRRAICKDVVLCCFKCNQERNHEDMENVLSNYKYKWKSIDLIKLLKRHG